MIGLVEELRKTADGAACRRTPELVKQAADALEKQDRLLGLYRLRETLRVHPNPQAAIRLKEVIDEIKQREAAE